MTTNAYRNLLADSDPAIGLLMSIILRAKNDALLGSLEAAAWLLTDGTRIVEALAPGSDAPRAIVELCQEVLERVDRGRLKARWQVG